MCDAAAWRCACGTIREPAPTAFTSAWPPVPMGASRAEAAASIRLAVQVNDWSLRRYAPLEMKTGFGWILAEPPCSMARIAVTPDELGSAWQDQRILATLVSSEPANVFGAVPAAEMSRGFDELIAHASRSRPLCAGTLLGSGTVSHSRYREVGSCCISERRAIEMIDHDGVAATPFLRFGERVRMLEIDETELPLFGVHAHHRLGCERGASDVDT